MEVKVTATIKILCSYGGKILPRYPDGKLRYHGGETRVITVDRSLSLTELLVKLGGLCGAPVTLRCQLPTEDLDGLVSINSDDDLANLIQEYDRTATVHSSSNLKIRAFLSLPKKSSHITSTVVTDAASETPSPESPLTCASYSPPRSTTSTTNNFIQQMSKPPGKLPFRYDKSAGKLLRYACKNSRLR